MANNIIKNTDEKEIKDMTREELQEALVKWSNLREFGPEMVEETHNRILQAKKELDNKFTSKKRKEELKKSLNALQYVFMQTQKNIEVSGIMLSEIKREMRLRFRQEMAKYFKDSLK